MSQNRKLVIGKIRTSYGVKGHVKIFNFSGENDHFFNLEKISLEQGNRKEILKVENVFAHGNDLILKFEGIESPEEAKKYIGWEIWVPRENASVLRDGEYYIADLYGCELVGVSADGEEPRLYGVVRSVLYESGTSDYLEIESGELDDKNRKKVFLIPFRKEFIGKVDTAGRTIELLAEWIIP